MKNTHSYRLTAILLAAIMMISILPAAGADFVLGGIYTYLATQDATITFASDGQNVAGVAELIPNKASTMTVSIPGGEALPVNSNGETIVDVPENVIVTSGDAAACQSSTVSCSYRAARNQLVFKWKGNAYTEEGFTATIPITPDVPASREDVSGNWVFTLRNNRANLVIQPSIARIDGENRLTAVVGEIKNGEVSANNDDLPTWKFTRVSGDWYTISYNGLYLNFGNNGNNVSLSGTPQYFLYMITADGCNQFAGLDSQGTKYYLNNKQHNVSKGLRASTYGDQTIELYRKYQAPEGQSVVKFSTNGGSVAQLFETIVTEEGSTITLPDYNGTKNNGKFIGWSKYSNIYEFHDGHDYSYCEVYLPGTEYKASSGMNTLYAVYNEKGTKVRFGFRIDGTIPKEPGNYPNQYTGHIEIENSLKIGRWVIDVDGNKPVEGNHVVNNVTENLSILPSDAQIKAKLGNKYDPETMYVHWYVLKYAGQWKVDGVIRTRAAKSVAYDMNLNNTDRSRFVDMPNGFEYGQKATITVGAEKDGTIKEPSLEGYEFLGWNTKADGTGTAYETGAQIDVTESMTFYAQWKQIPKYEVTYTLNNAARNAEIPPAAEYQETTIFELPEAEDREGYIFSGWSVNGEIIEGNTFEMPAEPVEITGTYYGPIDVKIKSNWNDGDIGYPGATIVLKAVTDCADDLDYEFQWMYKSGDEWKEIPGATGDTITYTLDEETSGRRWRVVVTNARLRQN